MWRAIPALVQRFSDDVNVRSIAITGAGEEAFAAGADISEFAANRDDAEAARLYDAMTLDAFAALQGCRKPALAMMGAIASAAGWRWRWPATCGSPPSARSSPCRRPASASPIRAPA